VTADRHLETDVFEEYCDVPATGENPGNLSSGVTTRADVSHASTARGSRPGARKPRLTDSRRLSDRTCPKCEQKSAVTRVPGE